jgi:8-oxo-dGTP pyrophosphatase MutT (NUDIX family)
MINGRPKAKTMALITRQTNNKTQILATEGVDHIKNEVFYRLIGGHIEVGETAIAALKREIKEELNLDLNVGDVQFWLENIFTYNGNIGHEIIAICKVTANEGITLQEEYTIIDSPGVKAKWINLEDIENGSVRLYPLGAIKVP